MLTYEVFGKRPPEFKERSTPMEEKILSAVSTVGFPIVITFYLLIRFQTTMDKFCDKLDALILEIRKEHA